MENNKKVLLSIEDLVVKFHVRGRVLTAIRGVSLDIYENESIAIVGESGSGKSVLTKTFAGMLDENGFIDNGQIIFSDEELSDTVVPRKLLSADHALIQNLHCRLNSYAGLEAGAQTYRQILELRREKTQRATLSEAESASLSERIAELRFQRTELFNKKQTYDSSKEKPLIHAASKKIAEFDAQIKQAEKTRREMIAKHREALSKDVAYLKEYDAKMRALQEQYRLEKQTKVTEEQSERNLILAKEIYLSVRRFGAFRCQRYARKLLNAIAKAMKLGVDLDNENERNAVFDNVAFRVRYLDENEERLHGICNLNLAKIKYSKDWSQIRGGKIATVFQDPMTSLNPIITIGKQITSIILKHQNCSEAEARERALVLMKKVGIPNAEQRFDDYPFQYSGGMRQRIVIAIALSCQPKILICDEPTTALDVTIQAQILQLLKDLQKEFNYTIVFITHDLGVVANIADRVAVLYAGQVVELGTVEDVFFDPRHPYTWALLSSMPQLAQRNTELYSISGTPPSLYNQIKGDPFAPRNPYCLKVDTLKEPPMFAVSDTHFAKTWLLDERAPKVEKPEIIQNIHEKLLNAFNIEEI